MSQKKQCTYWHRNVDGKRYRQRYFRLLHKVIDPDVIERGAGYDYDPDYEDPRDPWDPYDPCCRIEEGTDYDFIYFLDKLIFSHSPFSIISYQLSPKCDNDFLCTSTTRSNKIFILEYLKKLKVFFRYDFSYIDEDYDLITSKILESISNNEIEALNYILGDNNIDIIKILIVFSPLWVRSPLTFNGNSQLKLFEHLFCRYDVPAFLRKSWFRSFRNIEWKWITWFILIGQGIGLKRAAEDFSWNIPSRFEHHLLDAPEDLSPVMACIHAEVKRLGGSERDVERILAHYGFVIDPTEYSRNATHDIFWRETVKWIIAHGDDMTDEECDLVLDWALHEYTEAERRNARPFSWKRRSLARVLERSLAYSRSLRKKRFNHTWNKHGWDWDRSDVDGETWSFVELVSSCDLQEEGARQRHCVARYDSRCVSGHSAIVSLRLNGARLLTIEVNPRTSSLVQVKGRRNRKPNAHEMDIIRRWQRAVLDAAPVQGA